MNTRTRESIDLECDYWLAVLAELLTLNEQVGNLRVVGWPSSRSRDAIGEMQTTLERLIALARGRAAAIKAEL